MKKTTAAGVITASLLVCGSASAEYFDTTGMTVTDYDKCEIAYRNGIPVEAWDDTQVGEGKGGSMKPLRQIRYYIYDYRVYQLRIMENRNKENSFEIRCGSTGIYR